MSQDSLRQLTFCLQTSSSILAIINLATGDKGIAAHVRIKKTYPDLYKEVEAAGMSPYKRRFLLEPLLPSDGSYKGRWGLLGTREWELEYIDWSKMEIRYTDDAYES